MLDCGSLVYPFLYTSLTLIGAAPAFIKFVNLRHFQMKGLQ